MTMDLLKSIAADPQAAKIEDEAPRTSEAEEPRNTGTETVVKDGQIIVINHDTRTITRLHMIPTATTPTSQSTLTGAGLVIMLLGALVAFLVVSGLVQ